VERDLLLWEERVDEEHNASGEDQLPAERKTFESVHVSLSGSQRFGPERIESLLRQLLHDWQAHVKP
jgi:hypothetical protein